MINPKAPWHTVSYDRFISKGLPDLLAGRLPVSSYDWSYDHAHTASIRIGVNGVVLAQEVPRPDVNGVFDVRSSPHGDQGFRVVIPYPETEDVAASRIKCVGEQLLAYLDERLGKAPDGVDWDASLLASWLPIADWVHSFLASEPTSQYLQNANWIDRWTHIRRLTLIPTQASHFLLDDASISRSYVEGLTCPINTPSGPNAGWIVEIALGAEIRDERLVRVVEDTDPTWDLGLTSAIVPFMEHDDCARLGFGMNMIRQWVAARNPGGTDAERTTQSLPESCQHLDAQETGPKPEPALVQTGNEVDTPDFWGGYNLLTAFIMWDGYSFEDGLVVSASAAERMGFPRPLIAGDKLSNRHGFKGVVSRILPDDEMPRLPDRRAVDIIVPPTGVISRQNFGQIREAVMGRIAEAEGQTAVVPPFQSPDPDALKARLRTAGLPEDGMEQLTVDGSPLAHRSTVGVVYWGRTLHLAADKLSSTPQSFGEKQVALLVERNALSVASDFIGRHPDDETPLMRLSTVLEQKGITSRFDGETVAFAFDRNDGARLPVEIPHPWADGMSLDRVPPSAGNDVERARAELEKLVAGRAPEVLVSAASARLEEAVVHCYGEDDVQEALSLSARVPTSGRAVLGPGPDLTVEQASIPLALAWTLFGHLVADRVGSDESERRTAKARKALEDVAADQWVVLYSPHCFEWTALTAFRPVIRDEMVVRINPRICGMLDVDFDGDTVGVYVPTSSEAQAQAGAELSVAGHLRSLRESNGPLHGLIQRVHGMVWGLVERARSEPGRNRIREILGDQSTGDIRSKWDFNEEVDRLFRATGTSDEEVGTLFKKLDELKDLAFETCRMSGVSVNPFLGEGLDLPDAPTTDDPALWEIYRGEVLAVMDGETDPDDDNLGTLNVFRFSGARGSDQQFFMYLGGHGPVQVEGGKVFVRHGFVQGLTKEELFARARQMHRDLARANLQLEQLRAPYLAPNSRAYGVLARARKSKRPGVVIGRAAARKEVDPLKDVEARLMAGIAG